eukprot:2410695-Rhodomonas_salina.2
MEGQGGREGGREGEKGRQTARERREERREEERRGEKRREEERRGAERREEGEGDHELAVAAVASAPALTLVQDLRQLPRRHLAAPHGSDTRVCACAVSTGRGRLGVENRQGLARSQRRAR